jgi:bifunctional NMN adenylyltransferase/nudix hydrolase
MSKKYDFMVFIGRMQPPHKAHIEIIERALEQATNVIVLIGSSNQPRTIKNPWTWREREDMIRACFDLSVQDNLAFFGISDTYNDQEWVRSVQDAISAIAPESVGAKIGLVGHKKDDSSYYLDMFPQWEFFGVDNIDDIHSTEIRTQMFELEQIDGANIPDGIYNYLNAFMNSNTFTALSGEYEFTMKYRQAWANAPYAPTFVTVDAVVVQSGHVLLVRRRAEPGKGLWALPGGFLNPNERIEDAALRELREETKLKVPTPVLKGNIKDTQVFDDPVRSLRGRTITHAHYIELPPGPLPKVKGSDDADKAKWVPLGVFEKMQDQLFEDHFHIVNYFVQ